MILTIKTAKLAVVDEVLPTDLFEAVCEEFLIDTFNPSLVVGKWSHVWRVDGMVPASTKAFLSSQGPHGHYIDVVGKAFSELTRHLSEMIGNYADLRVHSQIYGRGIRVGWHSDKHSVGSFTFYAHREWRAGWGGELMIPSNDDRPNSKKVDWESAYAEQNGYGMWISPKPNRCILLAPGVVHSVNRVDADAGAAQRCVVIGFLLPLETKSV